MRFSCFHATAKACSRTQRRSEPQGLETISYTVTRENETVIELTTVSTKQSAAAAGNSVAHTQRLTIQHQSTTIHLNTPPTELTQAARGMLQVPVL